MIVLNLDTGPAPEYSGITLALREPGFLRSHGQTTSDADRLFISASDLNPSPWYVRPLSLFRVCETSPDSKPHFCVVVCPASFAPPQILDLHRCCSI